MGDHYFSSALPIIITFAVQIIDTHENGTETGIFFVWILVINSVNM